jgi:hypothetical protein
MCFTSLEKHCTQTRELMENSLDAIDMIDVPTPYIKISM